MPDSKSVPVQLDSHTLQCSCWFSSAAGRGGGDTAKMDTSYISINSHSGIGILRNYFNYLAGLQRDAGFLVCIQVLLSVEEKP